MWRLGREKDFFSVEKEGSKREEACAAKRPGQSGKYAAAPSAAATEAGAWRVRVDLHAFTPRQSNRPQRQHPVLVTTAPSLPRRPQIGRPAPPKPQGGRSGGI